MANRDPSEKKFETALKELEKVVEQLESGDLSLEDSLEIFERGVGLVKFCNEKLNEVEKKIEILVRGKDGTPQLKTFDTSMDKLVREPGE